MMWILILCSISQYPLIVHCTFFHRMWPGAARSTRTVLVSTSASGRSGGSRLLTLSPVGRGWSPWPAYGQSGLVHLTVWPSLPDCFTSNNRLVAHVWPSVFPQFSTAGGLDLQWCEIGKYISQISISFSIVARIIVWIHSVLLCKIIFVSLLGASLPHIKNGIKHTIP